MRITILNTWGGRLYDDLRAALVADPSDIFCLQEIVHSPTSPKDWLTYRDTGIELAQRAKLFEDLCDALPDHHGIFCPAAQGELFDVDTAIPSQWGLATFIHKRHILIGQMQDLVFGAFSANGYGRHPRSRSAHVIRVFDTETGVPITVAHMHGLRDPQAGKADTPERDDQCARFVEMIQSLHRPAERLVIGGDFNVLPGSATLQTFERLGLTELVTSRGFKSTRTTHYPKPGRFADYLLVSPNVLVRAFDVVTKPAVSDHAALVLQI